MFVADFHVGLGVLVVDTAHFTTNHVTESPPHNEAFLQESNFQLMLQTLGTEICPGDVPVLKQKPVSASQLFFDGTVGTTLQANIVVEIFPGDVPWPK